MTNDAKTRAALIQAAKDFLTGNATINTTEGPVENLPVLPATAIGWENKNFDPAGNEVWSSVFYLPNQPTARTIGVGGIDEINGFLQIDFNIPPDSGEKELISWGEKARLFFHAGRSFSYEGHSVLVTSSGMSQSRHVENNFRQSLTVAFKSHIKRPQLT